LDLSETDCLCALGGDGTAHEVTNGLLERAEDDEARARVVLALVPCGSGNTVAHDLGVSTIDQSIASLMRGTVRSMDVARVERLDIAKSSAEPVASTDEHGNGAASSDASSADGAPHDDAQPDVHSSSPPVAPSTTASPAPADQVDGVSSEEGNEGQPRKSKSKSLFRRSLRAGRKSHASVEVNNPLAAGARADAYPNTCYAVNIAGYGLPAALMRSANNLRWLGAAQYQIATYMALVTNVGYKCTVRYTDAEDKEFVVKGTFSMVRAQLRVCRLIWLIRWATCTVCCLCLFTG
jgi:hypothetical protein